jgi:hypothetical protein
MSSLVVCNAVSRTAEGTRVSRWLSKYSAYGRVAVTKSTIVCCISPVPALNGSSNSTALKS